MLRGGRAAAWTCSRTDGGVHGRRHRRFPDPVSRSGRGGFHGYRRRVLLRALRKGEKPAIGAESGGTRLGALPEPVVPMSAPEGEGGQDMDCGPGDPRHRLMSAIRIRAAPVRRYPFAVSGADRDLHGVARIGRFRVRFRRMPEGRGREVRRPWQELPKGCPNPFPRIGTSPCRKGCPGGVFGGQTSDSVAPALSEPSVDWDCCAAEGRVIFSGGSGIISSTVYRIHGRGWRG